MATKRSPILYHKTNDWLGQDCFVDGTNERWICAQGLDKIFPGVFDNAEKIQVVAVNYPEYMQIPRELRVLVVPDVRSLPVRREDFSEILIRHFGSTAADWFVVFEPLGNFFYDCCLAGFSTYTVEIIESCLNVIVLPTPTDETRIAA